MTYLQLKNAIEKVQELAAQEFEITMLPVQDGWDAQERTQQLAALNVIWNQEIE